MRILNAEEFQYRVLRTFYHLAPFPIKGNLGPNKRVLKPGYISCLIISNRAAFLDNLLSDLSHQSLPKHAFEVVIIFDQQGEEIKGLVEKYRPFLDIYFYQTDQPVRLLSNLRNISVSLSKGEFLLFLDDDTRIFQEDYLQVALKVFNETDCDAIIPQANPLFGIVKGRYDFIDRFSFANRCLFYRRSIVEELGGFLKGLKAYEDIELSIRLMINKPKIVQDERLNYYHAPLYFDSMQKPLAIGGAIFQLRGHYSFWVWLLVYLNALRFLTYGLLPLERSHHWFKISLGVFLYPFARGEYYY